MYGIYLACIGLVSAMLGSCRHLPTRSHAQPAPAPLMHFYDYQLVSSATQQPSHLSSWCTNWRAVTSSLWVSCIAIARRTICKCSCWPHSTHTIHS